MFCVPGSRPACRPAPRTDAFCSTSKTLAGWSISPPGAGALPAETGCASVATTATIPPPGEAAKARPRLKRR